MDEYAYYAEPGAMTRLEGHDDALAGLPTDPVSLANTVQGLIVHEFWVMHYGIGVPPERANEVERRSADEIITGILALDDRPLVEPRPPEQRHFGNCRMFSTFACALLRRAGIPARARCGFGAYFEPGRFVDHWIVEYYDGRWIQLDPQLDATQRAALGIAWDTTDMPRGQFVTGGEAWERCRAGAADPERFGILDMWGTTFIRGNAIRDLASLNKVEVLPWDGWRVMEEADDDLADRVAAATHDWTAARSLYESNDGLRVPPVVFSYRLGQPVTLPI